MGAYHHIIYSLHHYHYHIHYYTINLNASEFSHTYPYTVSAEAQRVVLPLIFIKKHKIYNNMSRAFFTLLLACLFITSTLTAPTVVSYIVEVEE